jgi:hypothetical protein
MSKSGTRTQTHYDTMGVKLTASPQQIRRAFRDLSKLYHPDTTELPASEATEKFQQLNEAYAVLSSPERRWQYDQKMGYARISVMQPMQSLAKEATTAPRKPSGNMYLDPTERPLSAGEIFALFILGLTFVACLVLVFTVALTRGDAALDPIEIAPTQVTELTSPGDVVAPTSPGVPQASQTDQLPSSAVPQPAPGLPQPRQVSNPASPTWL